MNPRLLIPTLIFLSGCVASEPTGAPTPEPPTPKPVAVIWSNDFESEPVGEEPLKLLVLNGDFAVQQEPGNRFLRLEGNNTEALGVLAGPSRRENVQISARVRAEQRRRLRALGYADD